jgi:peptidoglycan hydrolase CwlO-like protein
MYQAGGGSFYVAENETIVDPFAAATITPTLATELLKCDELVQRDLRYAHLVAGASKMPMSMIWVARNQDQPVTDADLAALKDIAWTELVKKRYLPGLAGTTTVRAAADSMLEIVREMNLQRRRFLIMGLHEQVEASEIQLILHLCQAEIIRTDNYRATANRYRRHDKLFEAFALAVGAFVCASAPYTLGSGTTRYERDLQFEYKKTVTALFVWALRKVNDVRGMDEDYVARISRLIVVKPDEGGDDRRVGFLGDSGGPPDTSSRNYQVLLDAVAEAQNKAETALTRVVKLGAEGKAWMEKMAGAEAGLREREAHMSEKMDLFTAKLAAQGDENVARVKLECEEKNRNLERTMRDLYSNGLKAGDDSNPMDLLKQEIVADLGQSINAVNVRLATSLQSHTEAMTRQIQQLQQGGVDALAKIGRLSELIKTVFSYLGAPLRDDLTMNTLLSPGEMTKFITNMQTQIDQSLHNSRANEALIASLDATGKATNETLQSLTTKVQTNTAAIAAKDTEIAELRAGIARLTASIQPLLVDQSPQILADCTAQCSRLIEESNSSTKKTVDEINQQLVEFSYDIQELEAQITQEGEAPTMMDEQELAARVAAELTQERLTPLVNTAIQTIIGPATGPQSQDYVRIMAAIGNTLQALHDRIARLDERVNMLNVRTQGAADTAEGVFDAPPDEPTFDATFQKDDIPRAAMRAGGENYKRRAVESAEDRPSSAGETRPRPPAGEAGRPASARN